MKKIFFTILLMVGFLLAVSESATIIPNFVGLGLAAYCLDKLKVFAA